jgi:flagellar protein FlgJ
MSTQPLINNVNDMGQFTQLRSAARNNDPEALKTAARQFEALFTQQLLKTARESKIGDDLMGGQQTEFYQGMFDQQIAQKMSEGRGLGIADLLVRQLQGKQSMNASPVTKADAINHFKPLVFHPKNELNPPAELPKSEDTAKSLDFVSTMLPHAEAAARELGVPAKVLVAQAALETGWGRHQECRRVSKL